MSQDDAELNEFGRFAEPALLILTSLADGPKHGYAMTEDIASIAGVLVLTPFAASATPADLDPTFGGGDGMAEVSLGSGPSRAARSSSSAKSSGRATIRASWSPG